jgi:hypothetical protein
MLSAGNRARGRMLAFILTLCACRTAPRSAARAALGAGDAGLPSDEVADAGAPQAGAIVGEVNGTPVLALAVPQFAQLPRDQRLLAYWASLAGAAGESTALDQSYRNNLTIVRILRAILEHPAVVPPAVLPRIRAFARAVWLNGGLHDPETGRKETPQFTLSELRGAALAAQASGADLGQGTVSLEFALRALDGPLFDPRVDALRTARGADLGASAVNFYASVTQRDLRGLHEKYVLNSRLARDETLIVERVIRLPAAAASLEQALAFAAPPQRAVLEPLAAFLRTGEADPFRAAQRAWVEAAGPVDFFAGFFDRSADPRGRKAIFGAFVGVADPERAPVLEALAQAAPQLEEKLPWPPAQRRPFARPAAAEALLLASASGGMRPLRWFGLTLPLDAAQRDLAGAKTALFAAADDALGRLSTDAALRALADPSIAPQLERCLPQLRFAFLSLREISGRPAGRAPPGDPAGALEGGFGAFEEARSDLAAHVLSADPLLPRIGLLTTSCQKLWPQFAAASWLLNAAGVPQGDRIDDDRLRAVQLEIWWFIGKGALLERHDGARRFLSAPDPARFHSAAAELLALLREIETLGDGARLNDLLDRHASHIDVKWRDDVLERLRAAGIPRRVAVIPPQLRAVVTNGKVVDAEATQVEDLDAQVLRDWKNL